MTPSMHFFFAERPPPPQPVLRCESYESQLTADAIGTAALRNDV